MLINLRLALLSAGLLKEVRSETGIAYDHGERGILKIARDQPGLDEARAEAELLAEHGELPFQVLDRAGVLAAEPAALAEGGEAICGGLLFPEDESGDCHLFTRRLAEAFQAGGGSLRLAATVDRIEAAGDRIIAVHAAGQRLEADAYVLALGWSSPALVRDLGLRLPIVPVKGYPSRCRRAAGTIRRAWRSSTRSSAWCRSANRLRLAGSAEFTGADLTLNRRRSDYIWRTALKVYPALGRHADPDAVERWTGLRPMTPDGPPILGAHPLPQSAAEHRARPPGWTFACGSAQVIAALIGGREPRRSRSTG